MNVARWLACEPVRVYIYGIGVAVIAVLTYRGVLDPTESGLWLAVAAAVVAVPVTAESLRSRVTPTGRRVAGRDYTDG